MKKYYLFFEEGSVINQVICTVLVNLPVFAFGACIGWMSPMTLLLQSENSPRGTPLTDFEVSWMAAAAYLVCVPMDFLMVYMGDKFGRKITLLFVSSSIVACWLIKLSSFSTWAFISARALVGISMAGSYVICPLYTKEISQDSIRGLLGSMVTLFHTSGNLLIYILGDILSYNTVLWICVSIPVIHLILFLMMPESPSYLLKRGKHDEAAKALAWLRCRKEDDILVHKELADITREQENDKESSKFVVKAIVQDSILSRAFRICIILVLARELCGSIPVLNFAGNIFAMASEGTGLVLTPNQQAMLLGGVQVAGSALGSSIVEKTGRKDQFEIRHAFRICIILILARELCGSIPMLNFAGNIFAMASEGTGLVLTPNQQAMLLGGVQVAGSALGSSIVEKTGRKALFMFTSLVSGLSMCTLASWFLARYCDFHAPDWIPILTLCLCIFCDSSGLQPVSVVIVSEMFSFKYRGTVMGVSMAAASLLCFIQMALFKPIVASVGVHVAFYVFGFVCILSALYALLKLPETKQRGLEEIYECLKTKKERLAEKNVEKKVAEA